MPTKNILRETIVQQQHSNILPKLLNILPYVLHLLAYTSSYDAYVFIIALIKIYFKDFAMHVDVKIIGQKCDLKERDSLLR